MSPKHRLQGSYYWIRFLRKPDNLNAGFPTYPDFPAFGNAEQYRTLGSASLRSTISSTIVNEARGGWQWAPVGFSTNGNAAQFENQGGFNIGLGGFRCCYVKASELKGEKPSAQARTATRQAPDGVTKDLTK